MASFGGRSVGCSLFALLVIALPVKGYAQEDEKPKPFKPIAVTFNAERLDDPSFKAFSTYAQTVLAKRNIAGLRDIVLPTFYYDRDFGGMHDRKASAVVNFKRAFSLEERPVSCEMNPNWAKLQRLLREEIATRHDTRAQDLCVPAFPTAGVTKQIEALAEATDTTAMDWAFLSARTQVRRSPSEADAVVARLDPQVVRVRDWGARSDCEATWAEIWMPSGQRGFVKSAELASTVDDRLCVRKSNDGRWGISGYVGGGD